MIFSFLIYVFLIYLAGRAVLFFYKEWKLKKHQEYMQLFVVDNQWGKFWGIRREKNETHEDFMKRLWLASGLDRSSFQSPYPWPPKNFYTQSNNNNNGCETKQKLKEEAEKRFKERSKSCEGSEISVLATDESRK